MMGSAPGCGKSFINVGARFSPLRTILFVSEVGRRQRNADFAFNSAVSISATLPSALTGKMDITAAPNPIPSPGSGLASIVIAPHADAPTGTHAVTMKATDQYGVTKNATLTVTISSSTDTRKLIVNGGFEDDPDDFDGAWNGASSAIELVASAAARRKCAMAS